MLSFKTGHPSAFLRSDSLLPPRALGSSGPQLWPQFCSPWTLICPKGTKSPCAQKPQTAVSMSAELSIRLRMSVHQLINDQKINVHLDPVHQAATSKDPGIFPKSCSHSKLPLFRIFSRLSFLPIVLISFERKSSHLKSAHLMFGNSHLEWQRTENFIFPNTLY